MLCSIFPLHTRNFDFNVSVVVIKISVIVGGGHNPPDGWTDKQYSNCSNLVYSLSVRPSEVLCLPATHYDGYFNNNKQKHRNQ